MSRYTYNDLREGGCFLDLPPSPLLRQEEWDAAADKMYMDALQAHKASCQASPPAPSLIHEYFITLTCTTDLPMLIIRLKRILKGKTFGIEKAVGCIELTKQGQPHIHFLCESTRKYMDKAKLRRSNKDMVDLQRPRSEENVYNYIRKPDTKPSLEYLNKYNMKFPYFNYTKENGITWDSNVIEISSDETASQKSQGSESGSESPSRSEPSLSEAVIGSA